MPYSPLCRGYLTGSINERTKFNPKNDNRPSLPRYQPEAIKANWVMIDLLTEFGNQRGLTAAQVALAWLQAQRHWIVPIPGTTKLAHFQENMMSSQYKFSPQVLERFTQTAPKIAIVGDRIYRTIGATDQPVAFRNSAWSRQDRLRHALNEYAAHHRSQWNHLRMRAR